MQGGGGGGCVCGWGGWRACLHFFFFCFYSLIFCSPFPFFCSFFIILPIAPLWANCRLRAPAPTGREGEGCGGVEGIMTGNRMKGERTGKVGENKVALIRTCQEQCAHKTVRESNLVFAVSLSDISAISCHRSECEQGVLSDFLKSHRWKHEGTSSHWEFKKKKKKKKKKARRGKKLPLPTPQMDRFFIHPANKCQLPLGSFVLLLSAAHSGFKWIFFLYISPQGWLWGVIVLFAPCVTQLCCMFFFGRVSTYWGLGGRGGDSRNVLDTISQEQLHWGCISGKLIYL